MAGEMVDDMLMQDPSSSQMSPFPLSIDESLERKGVVLLEDNLMNGPLACKKMLWNIATSDFGTPNEKGEKDDIFLIINCCGGEIFEFLSLHDTIMLIRSKFKKDVVTIVNGIAASGAAIASQAGSIRAATNNSYIMLHEASDVIEGSTASMEYDIFVQKKMQETVFKIWAKSMGMSSKALRDMLDDKDRFFTAPEAKKAGLIDQIIKF